MSSYSREKKNCKIDNKKDWRREKKVEADHRKIQEMVPRKYLKWRKVFGKVIAIQPETTWSHSGSKSTKRT